MCTGSRSDPDNAKHDQDPETHRQRSRRRQTRSGRRIRRQQNQAAADFTRKTSTSKQEVTSKQTARSRNTKALGAKHNASQLWASAHGSNLGRGNAEAAGDEAAGECSQERACETGGAGGAGGSTSSGAAGARGWAERPRGGSRSAASGGGTPPTPPLGTSNGEPESRTEPQQLARDTSTDAIERRSIQLLASNRSHRVSLRRTKQKTAPPSRRLQLERPTAALRARRLLLARRIRQLPARNQRESRETKQNTAPHSRAPGSSETESAQALVVTISRAESASSWTDTKTCESRGHRTKHEATQQRLRLERHAPARSLRRTEVRERIRCQGRIRHSGRSVLHPHRRELQLKTRHSSPTEHSKHEKAKRAKNPEVSHLPLAARQSISKLHGLRLQTIPAVIHARAVPPNAVLLLLHQPARHL